MHMKENRKNRKNKWCESWWTGRKGKTHNWESETRSLQFL